MISFKISLNSDYYLFERCNRIIAIISTKKFFCDGKIKTMRVIFKCNYCKMVLYEIQQHKKTQKLEF